jgi:hypothetical protein
MLPNNYLYLFKFIGGIFAYYIYLALFNSKLKKPPPAEKGRWWRAWW